MGVSLEVRPDDTNSGAVIIDIYSMGVFNSEQRLVGHVPKELSRLLHDFYHRDFGNTLRVEVIGPRLKEVGLVVPAQYELYSQVKKDIFMLDKLLTTVNGVHISAKEKYLYISV